MGRGTGAGRAGYCLHWWYGIRSPGGGLVASVHWTRRGPCWKQTEPHHGAQAWAGCWPVPGSPPDTARAGARLSPAPLTSDGLAALRAILTACEVTGADEILVDRGTP